MRPGRRRGRGAAAAAAATRRTTRRRRRTVSKRGPTPPEPAIRDRTRGRATAPRWIVRGRVVPNGSNRTRRADPRPRAEPAIRDRTRGRAAAPRWIVRGRLAPNGSNRTRRADPRPRRSQRSETALAAAPRRRGGSSADGSCQTDRRRSNAARAAGAARFDAALRRDAALPSARPSDSKKTRRSSPAGSRPRNPKSASARPSTRSARPRATRTAAASCAVTNHSVRPASNFAEISAGCSGTNHSVRPASNKFRQDVQEHARFTLRTPHLEGIVKFGCHTGREKAEAALDETRRELAAARDAAAAARGEIRDREDDYASDGAVTRQSGLEDSPEFRRDVQEHPRSAPPRKAVPPQVREIVVLRHELASARRRGESLKGDASLEALARSGDEAKLRAALAPTCKRRDARVRRAERPLMRRGAAALSWIVRGGWTRTSRKRHWAWLSTLRRGYNVDIPWRRVRGGRPRPRRE